MPARRCYAPAMEDDDRSHAINEDAWAAELTPQQFAVTLQLFDEVTQILIVHSLRYPSG